MKETIFMRVLFCKIHCPFTCFCKPSAAHLYTPGPLKLDSSPHIVHPTAHAVSEETVNGKHESESESVLRSCIRKFPAEEVGKKRVEWVDSLGRELAEIKEFESSETGDTDNEEDSSSQCLCVIL